MKNHKFSISAFYKTAVLAATIIAGAWFSQLQAQCNNFQDAGNVLYGIRVVNPTATPIQYEAYAYPTTSGCQLIGNSQFSLIVSQNATINIINSNSSGTPGFTWSINTNVVFNGFKYSAAGTSGSTGGVTFNANDETSLFTFTITGTCTAGVRIFNNNTDPGSGTLNNADFRNTFAVIVPNGREAYVSNISDFQNCPATILPLTLTSFEARATSNKQVQLSWQTLNETNTRQFSVERSQKANGNAWQLVGTVAAAGTVLGNRSYQLTDSKPLDGVNFYRLRTTDRDGKESISEIKQVNFNSNSLLAASVYPNPVVRGGAITVTVAETIRYRLLDKTGRLIAAGTFAAGNSRLKAPNASGAYLLEITGVQSNSSKEHYRIIVQ